MNPATNVKSIVPYIGSMDFDGVDDHVEASKIVFGTNPYTIRWKGWAKTLKSNNVFISQRASGLSTEGGFTFRNEGADGSVRILCFRANSTSQFKSSITNANFIRQNELVDLVFSFEDQVIKLWKNGVPVLLTIQSDGSTSTTAGGFFVGQQINASWGDIKTLNARCYKRGLTDSEVLNLHLHNVTPYDNNPSICKLNLETTANQIKGDQWLDKSGNNNHATIVGPTFSYESPTKRIAQLGAPRKLDGRLDGVVSGGVTIADGAMVFDGVSGYLSGMNALKSLTAPQAIAVWIQRDNNNNFPTTDQFKFFTQENLWFGGRDANWRFGTGANTVVTASKANYPYTNVNFLYGEYDGNSLNFYINNVHVGSLETALSQTLNPGDFGFLGGVITASRFFNGMMTNALAFNRTLTAEERTAIFNAGKDAPCPVKRGLVAEYSGRDYEGPAATPTKIFDTASWDGHNVQ